MNGHIFKNFGSHSNSTNFSYFTAAAAIGVKKPEIDLFIKRLNKTFESVKNQKHQPNFWF